MVKVDLNGQMVSIDNFLLQKLDNIKYIIKKNWDCVILIDGEERAGKSTLGITMATYLDKNFSINNISRDLEDAKKKIQNLPDKSILLIDEGSLVFNSKDAMTRGQKELMKILDVVGQKNMIIIVILPSFFDLNKTIAVRRSRFLIHVYTGPKMNRGYFMYFGKKKKRILYEIGKKNFGSYRKPKSSFRGRFFKFDPFEEEYAKLKRQTLVSALKGDDNKKKELTATQFKAHLVHKAKSKLPIETVKDLYKALGIAEKSYYRHKPRENEPIPVIKPTIL